MEQVAKAVAECSFVTSSLPVVVSFEMHCSPKVQNQVARLMVKHLDSSLLPVRSVCRAASHSSFSVAIPPCAYQSCVPLVSRTVSNTRGYDEHAGTLTVGTERLRAAQRKAQAVDG